MQPLFGSQDGFRSFQLIDYQLPVSARRCFRCRAAYPAQRLRRPARLRQTVYKAGASQNGLTPRPAAKSYRHDLFTVGQHTDGAPGKLGGFIPHGTQPWTQALGALMPARTLQTR